MITGEDTSTIATEHSLSTSFVHVDAPPTNSEKGRSSNSDGIDAAAPAISLRVIPKHETIGMRCASVTSTHICVNLKGKEILDEDARAPVDIIVALDVSGSMQGSKLKLCKHTLEQLLGLLQSHDRFGLITYDTHARIVTSPMHMTSSNKQITLHKIKALRTGNWTNISAAIGLATQEMKSINRPNPVRSIFLLTDGHANHGITNKYDLVQLTKNCIDTADSSEEYTMVGLDVNNDDEDKTIKSTKTFLTDPLTWLELQPSKNTTRADDDGVNCKDDEAIPKEVSTKCPASPITMNCFGYGTDHCSELLRELAEAANGSYYFVETDTNVASAFGDALGGIFSVVAQNIVVTLQAFSPQNATKNSAIANVLHADTTKRENGSYAVYVGDLFAEETKDVLLEVELATVPEDNWQSGSEATPAIPHVAVMVAYTDTILKRPAKISPLMVSIARPDSDYITPAHPHVAAQAIRIHAAKQIELARSYADRNEFSLARSVIRNVRDTIQREDVTVRSNQWIQMIVEDLNDVEKGLESQHHYKTYGNHLMSTRFAAYETQRCAEGSSLRQARHSNFSSFKSLTVKKMTKN